jgi:hypothetical protein
MDERSTAGGLIDLMGNQNGVFVNTPVFNEPWSAEVDDGDGSIYFSTTRRAQVAHNPIFNGLTFLSIELLFKINTFAATGSHAYQNPIINKWGTESHPDDFFEVFVDSRDKKVWATAANGLGQNDSVISDTVINLNQWYRVVYTFDHGVLTLYLDDVLESQKITSFTSFNQGLGTPDIGIGGHASYTDRPFDGWVDEVVIYNTKWTGTFVDFIGSPLSGVSSVTVEFSDISTAQVLSWLWDFGDGDTSIEQNPIHTYDSVGVYTVVLTLTTNYGTEVVTKEDYVTVVPGPDFTATPRVLFEGFSSQFTDLSSNSPITWLWDFGDGSTSTEQNPLHLYSTIGYYTVSLTTFDGINTAEETKANYILVSQGPRDYIAGRRNPPQVKSPVGFRNL